MNKEEFGNFKESIVRGFRKWLESVDIDSEHFDMEMKEADMYDFVLLISLFDNYRMEVQQALAQREQQEKEQYEKEQRRKENSEKNQNPNKSNNGNIITPDFDK